MERELRGGSRRVGLLGLLSVVLGLFATGLWFVPSARALDKVERISFNTQRAENQEVFVMDPDGNYLDNRTNNPAADAFATFSPDGSQIAFTSTRDGNLEVYVMNADGGTPTNRTNDPNSDFGASWSPDGQTLVFKRAPVGTPDTGNWPIYRLSSVFPVDPISLKLLQDNVWSNEPSPFSPDGNKILFSTTRDGDREVYEMDKDGGNPQNLTKFPNFSDSAPAFSPDGSQIAFTSTRDGNIEVYVMNADGSDQKRLTNNASPDSRPAFSPDGNRIAFETRRDGNSEIYVMNANGSGEPTRLTNDPSPDQGPFWAAIPNICANVAPQPCATDIAVSNPGGVAAEAQTGTDQLDTTVTVPLEIRNDGPLDTPDSPPHDTTLNWSVYEGAGDCSTPSDAPWMSAAEQLDGGETAGETSTSETDVANIALDASALAPGTYNTVLCITSDDPDERVTSIPVKFTVQPKPAIAPPPPLPAAPAPLPLPPLQIAAKDTTAPVLTLLTVSKAKFRAGQKASFSFRLSEPARVTVSIKRKGSRKALGKLTARGVTGKNKISFAGKLKNKKLAPGKYVAEMVAVDASGNRSAVKKKSFEIRR